MGNENEKDYASKADKLLRSIGKPIPWTHQFTAVDKKARKISEQHQLKVDQTTWELLQMRTSWDLRKP